MRHIAIASLLMLAACAQPGISPAQLASRCEGFEIEAAAAKHPGIAARHAADARDCWSAIDRSARRAAIARAYALSEPFPVPVPYYPPVVSYIPDPVALPPMPPPAGNVEPRMLDIVMPPLPQAQTWGQTICAPAIAPVMWDEPVSNRNALIPGGC